MNDFAIENVRLSQEAEKLSVRVFCLKEAEERLKEMAKGQNLNVKNLRDLVSKNQSIIQEKKELIRTDIAEELISFILQADEDESGEFSDREIQILLGYVKTLPAIIVNEKRLKKTIERERSLYAVLDLVKDIGRHAMQPEDQIFIIKEEDKEFQTELSKRKTERETGVTRLASSGRELPAKELESRQSGPFYSSEEIWSKPFASQGHSHSRGLPKTAESSEVEESKKVGTQEKLSPKISDEKILVSRDESSWKDLEEQAIEIQQNEERQKTSKKTTMPGMKLFRRALASDFEERNKQKEKKDSSGRPRSVSPGRVTKAGKFVKKIAKLGPHSQHGGKGVP